MANLNPAYMHGSPHRGSLIFCQMQRVFLLRSNLGDVVEDCSLVLVDTFEYNPQYHTVNNPSRYSSCKTFRFVIRSSVASFFPGESCMQGFEAGGVALSRQPSRLHCLPRLSAATQG